MPGFSKGAGNGLRLIVYGYFDDSGKFADSEYIVLAGYLADLVVWETFCAQWGSILEKHHITAVHMSDMMALQGEYKKLNWTIQYRDQVVSEFIQVINNNLSRGIGVAVNVHHVRAMSNQAKRWIGDPYLLCIKLLMQQVVDQLLSFNYKSAIPIIFDDSEEFSVRVHSLLAKLIRKIPEVRDIVASITFGNDNWFYPLQAADMLAWETHKYLKDLKGKTTDDADDVLLGTSPLPYSGIIAGGAYLDKLAQRRERINFRW